MSKAAHTKGPWSVSCVRTRESGEPVLQILTSDSKAYAQVFYSDKTAADHAASYADAHLIAAAPDMLEALRNVNKLVSEAAMTGFNWKDGDWTDRLFHSQQKTSTAIAKAEGRS